MSKPMNAVILDDDPVIVSLLSRVLTQKGYEVSSYSSPISCPLYTEESCPCSWSGSCPDLIVTDYDMPTVNGIELVEHLKRKQCKCNNIAVISGSWSEHDLQKALPPGVSVFSKPFSLHRIRAWIDRIKWPGLGSGDNRRNFVRYPCELPVEVCFSSPGLLETVRAVARNISKGGMLVECSKALAPMTFCHLTFRVPDWMTLQNGYDREIMLAAQARHANDTSRIYGLQFLEPLA